MKRLVSLVMALLMICGCVGADADTLVEAGGNANITNGNIAGQGTDNIVGIQAQDNATVTAENVTVKSGSNEKDQGVGVQVINGNDVTVHTGDISVEGSHMAIGVDTAEEHKQVNIETGAISVVSNNGSITENGDDGVEYKVDDIANAVNNFGGNVTVGGDISSSGKQATGVVTTDGEIKIDGKITVKSESGSAAGITAGDGPEREVNTTVTVDKGIDATGASSATAIGINIFNKGDQASVTVRGDAKAVVAGDEASTEDNVVSARGIDVVNFGGDVATVEVKGNLSAEGGQMSEGVVVGHHEDNVEHAGITEIVVDGNVTARNGQETTSGIVVDNIINTIGITVGQGIIAEGGERVSGIDVNNVSGTVSITIENKGVSAKGDSEANGIIVNNLAGEASVSVTGDVVASGAEQNVGIWISGYKDESEDEDGEKEVIDEDQTPDKPETNVTVIGDVIGEDIGLLLDLENPDAVTDVLIDGTLSGEQSIVLTHEENIDNLTITVWKVEMNESGHVVESTEEADEDTQDANVPTALEQKIQYIIRLDAPETGGTFSTGGTTKHGDYDVAHEGDKVWVQVKLEEGYELDSVSNNGEVLILQDSDGNYYLNVPRGGGVLLSVKLKKKETTTPASENAQETAAAETTTPTAGTNNAAAPVVVVAAEPNPELELMNDLRHLLKLDDERISTNVTITRDPATGERTVHISPNGNFQGGTLSLELDLEILERMAAQRVTTIEVSSRDGNHQVLMSTNEVMRAVRNDEIFRFEMEEILETVDSEIVREMEGRYNLLMPATIVRLNIEDAQGNVREAESVGSILHIKEPADQDATFRFASENGTDTPVSASWNQAAEYWEMPFVGNGCYFAVRP